jgi:hypothetical protein
MAQMPIQSLSGRADALPAARQAAVIGQTSTALARTPYAFDKGGIPGGLLRPGSIDQALFKAQLEAAQKGAAAAPQATAHPHAEARSFAGIPNLTPAQLAALGAVEEPAEKSLVLDIPAQKPADAGTGGSAQADRFPFLTRKGAAAPLFSAAPAPPTGAAPVETAPAVGESPADTANTDTSEAAAAAADPSATEAPAKPATAPAAAPAREASVERGPIPGSRRGADGVWELTRLPDKDEREMLYGQKWRVVESEKSRELFLGPDGEFGWDDFLDLINPLQHIPFVNMAYRAVTGDEIYGAARMVDVALGPIAGASTAVDLAFRDVTGESMASNAIAAVFGTGGAGSGDESVGDVSVNTASATQLSDAGTIRRGSNK